MVFKQNGPELALLPSGIFRYPEAVRRQYCRSAKGISVKVIFRFGRILPASYLIFFQYTHGREAASGWRDCPEDFVRESESKDNVAPPISFDSGYRSPDMEMFPRMVPRL